MSTSRRILSKRKSKSLDSIIEKAKYLKKLRDEVKNSEPKAKLVLPQGRSIYDTQRENIEKNIRLQMARKEKLKEQEATASNLKKTVEPESSKEIAICPRNESSTEKFKKPFNGTLINPSMAPRHSASSSKMHSESSKSKTKHLAPINVSTLKKGDNMKTMSNYKSNEKISSTTKTKDSEILPNGKRRNSEIISSEVKRRA